MDLAFEAEAACFVETKRRRVLGCDDDAVVQRLLQALMQSCKQGRPEAEVLVGRVYVDAVEFRLTLERTVFEVTDNSCFGRGDQEERVVG